MVESGRRPYDSASELQIPKSRTTVKSDFIIKKF
jgi:hypothetical protein